MSPTAYQRARSLLLDAARANANAAQAAVDGGDFRKGRKFIDAALADVRKAIELQNQHQP